MLKINARLQKDIASVLRTAGALETSLDNCDELSPDQTQRIAYCCAEMVLLSLAASDEIEAGGEPTENMLRREVASALRHIALHALNVQEWESLENIRACFRTISQHCAFIEKAVELPPEDGLPEAESEEPQPLPALARIEGASLERLTHPAHPAGDDLAEKLKEEIRALREVLTSLIFERDHLIHVVCKEVEADYMRELGTIEAEIYHMECEARYLQRKLEMMQASVNRREEVKTERIDRDLRAQYEEYQRIYEEYMRRVTEAAEFRAGRNKKLKAAEKARRPKKGRTGSAETTSSEAAKEDDSEERQLKKLYRQIVKAMHPDLHPNQDEATKELFRKAILAYKDGDRKTLNEIAGTLKTAEIARAEDPVDALLREKTRLVTMIRGIMAEIRIVKTRFPYTKKELLDDPGRLAAEKEKLNERLSCARQAADIYKTRIAEMEKKHGRSDRTAE